MVTFSEQSHYTKKIPDSQLLIYEPDFKSCHYFFLLLFHIPAPVSQNETVVHGIKVYFGGVFAAIGRKCPKMGRPTSRDYPSDISDL